MIFNFILWSTSSLLYHKKHFFFWFDLTREIYQKAVFLVYNKQVFESPIRRTFFVIRIGKTMFSDPMSLLCQNYCIKNVCKMPFCVLATHVMQKWFFKNKIYNPPWRASFHTRARARLPRRRLGGMGRIEGVNGIFRNSCNRILSNKFVLRKCILFY